MQIDETAVQAALRSFTSLNEAERKAFRIAMGFVAEAQTETPAKRKPRGRKPKAQTEAAAEEK